MTKPHSSVGSGYVINSIMGDVYVEDVIGIGVDINLSALRATMELTKGKSVDLLKGSLMHSIVKRDVFDVIFCNPPYVPSEVYGKFDVKGN